MLWVPKLIETQPQSKDQVKGVIPTAKTSEWFRAMVSYGCGVQESLSMGPKGSEWQTGEGWVQKSRSLERNCAMGIDTWNGLDSNSWEAYSVPEKDELPKSPKYKLTDSEMKGKQERMKMAALSGS